MKAIDIGLPVAALAAALLLFGGFVWLGGASPIETWTILFKGAFGDWFSWQNTLQRAAPLMLAALCVVMFEWFIYNRNTATTPQSGPCATTAARHADQRRRQPRDAN